MKERPILFSAPMVRAILEGRKTQTRRVINPQPHPPMGITKIAPHQLDDLQEGFGFWDEDMEHRCRYGQPGDRLWVRETWNHEYYPDGPAVPGCVLFYRADYLDDPLGADLERSTDGIRRKWTPSIHMPRWASRLTLEITDIRAERLQDISGEDARAEGARWKDFGKCGSGNQLAGWSMEDPFPDHFGKCLNTVRMAFANYVNNLNDGKNWVFKSSNFWDANPWVWVIEFRRRL